MANYGGRQLHKKTPWHTIAGKPTPLWNSNLLCPSSLPSNMQCFVAFLTWSSFNFEEIFFHWARRLLLVQGGILARIGCFVDPTSFQLQSGELGKSKLVIFRAIWFLVCCGRARPQFYFVVFLLVKSGKRTRLFICCDLAISTQPLVFAMWALIGLLEENSFLAMFSFICNVWFNCSMFYGSPILILQWTQRQHRFWKDVLVFPLWTNSISATYIFLMLVLLKCFWTWEKLEFFLSICQCSQRNRCGDFWERYN